VELNCAQNQTYTIRSITYRTPHTTHEPERGCHEPNLKEQPNLVWSGLVYYRGRVTPIYAYMSVPRLYNVTPWLQSHWCA